MKFFFSNVTDYNLTKKGHHQGSFMWNLLNFSKQFFTRVTFDEKFCFIEAFMTFYQCFQHSYSISPITLRQLPWPCPIKTVIICLTKKNKNHENSHFSENFHGCALFIKIHMVKLLKQVSGIVIFLEFFFSEKLGCRAHEIVWSWDAFL